MITSESPAQLAATYLEMFPREAAEILDSFETKDVLNYLERVNQPVQKEIIQHLSPDTVAELMVAMPEEMCTTLLESLDPYAAAKLLSRTSKSFRSDQLKALSENKSKKIIELLNYPSDSAGFLMDTQIITFHPETPVDKVLQKLRSLKDKKVVFIYVVDTEGKLLGKVFIQKVAVSEPDVLLKDLVEPSDSIQMMASADEAVDIFEKGQIINLPVVDHENYMLGIIRSQTLISETQKDATEDVLMMFGAGKEEKALSHPWLAIRKRLPWLQINLATAFLAASIVGIFEETIAQVTVLAVFLPVVAGQSGNTGSQALAVAMRGLALREFQSNQWWKVARKEIIVGFINGIAVALTTSIIAYLWSSSIGIAFIIGSSMVLSMVIAGFSGAIVPIILKSFGQDPAQSASIVLTTVTDIMGFLSFLGLASLFGHALGLF